MDPAVLAQLEKVLALADLTHDAEALLAVRKAREILARDGLSFADLARAAARKPALSRAFSLFSAAPVQAQTQMMQLQQKLEDLQAELQTHEVQIDFWRRRSAELEEHFHGARSEAERWRRMAEETVEKLWSLGQEIKAEEFSPEHPIAGTKQKIA